MYLHCEQHKLLMAPSCIYSKPSLSMWTVTSWAVSVDKGWWWCQRCKVLQFYSFLIYSNLQFVEGRGGGEQRSDSGAQPMASMRGWARPPPATCTLPMLVTRNVAHTVIIQFLSCRDDSSYLTILPSFKVSLHLQSCLKSCLLPL